MIPTLLFAIPGSSNMAILMAALAFVGVAVGPNMLKDDLGLSYALAATVIFANLLAIPAFFAVVPWIVRLSTIKRDAIAPLAIAVSVTAALIGHPSLITVVVVFLSGALGVALKIAHWPRAPFVLGFVIEQMAENAAFQTASLWGWRALERPVTAVLAVAALGWLIFVARKPAALCLPGPRRPTLALAAVLGAVMAAALWLARGLSLQAGVAPIAIAAAAAVLCAAVFAIALRQKAEVAVGDEVRHLGLSAAFVALAPVAGVSAASFAYVATALLRTGVRPVSALASAVVFAILQFGLLAMVFDIGVEREILGRALWVALGH